MAPELGISCSYCNQPPDAVCTMCHCGFCKLHGDVKLLLCRVHARVMAGFAAAVCLILMALCCFLFWRHLF